MFCLCLLLHQTGHARRSVPLRLHRKMNLTRGIDLQKISNLMSTSSGAELKGCCTEAGMFALRERRVHVTQEDFEMAVTKIMKKVRGLAWRASVVSSDLCALLHARRILRRTRASGSCGSSRAQLICRFISSRIAKSTTLRMAENVIDLTSPTEPNPRPRKRLRQHPDVVDLSAPSANSESPRARIRNSRMRLSTSHVLHRQPRLWPSKSCLQSREQPTCEAGCGSRCDGNSATTNVRQNHCSPAARRQQRDRCVLWRSPCWPASSGGGNSRRAREQARPRRERLFSASPAPPAAGGYI